ncbi:MAG: hypothetical protein QOG88_1535 [Actinomycetota bacterium]|jgi:hypothetical protein|nr:hypothetical protein [Actinomycetota bacterium]
MSDGPGYRNAPSSQAPTRKGFLDSVLGYRPPGDAPIPKIRTAFARGVVAVCSTPWLLVASLVAVLVVWLGVVVSGFPGPFGVFAGFLAVPPVSTNMDVTLPTILLPTKVALLGGLVSVVPRGIFLALTTGMIVDVLDGKPVTGGSLRRGIRALPTAIGVCIVSIGFWIFTLLASQMLGPGIGILVQVGLPALGIYLFGFALTISVSERRGMAESLSKSVRAARIPGSNGLVLALLYVFGSAAAQVALTTGSVQHDVNPAVAAWAWVLVVNVFHVCMYATLAFRYLYMAEAVPDAPPRRLRGTAPVKKSVSAKAGSAKPQVKSQKGSSPSGSAKKRR